MVRLSRRLEKLSLSPEQFTALKTLAQSQSDIGALYLHGSYGTELQTVLSDLDLAVLPVPGSSWDLEREIELLSDLLGIVRNDDVNLINLRRVPVTLQMRVLESGRLLYLRDEVMLADFKESVIRWYCDFQPDLRQLYADFDAGLREEFL
ncbi:MAG: nucleotidyltransferase domain-containing protein [Clostridia bacterium]|nr:nucleotidyltransferase domain-containing protein [Clostridia bacterium]